MIGLTQYLINFTQNIKIFSKHKFKKVFIRYYSHYYKKAFFVTFDLVTILIDPNLQKFLI